MVYFIVEKFISKQWALLKVWRFIRGNISLQIGYDF